MNYALLKDGVVTNIIWLSPSNAHEFPAAVAINGMTVRVGDTYVDGMFYHDGERVLTELEIALAEAQAAQAAYEQGVQEA